MVEFSQIFLIWKSARKSITAIPMHLVRKRNKNKEIVIFGGEGMILCMNSMSNYW
jgi:hypothetical protein